MKFQIYSFSFKKQQGAALVTAMVFMGILTMLGISVMRSNTQDVKIHNAMKNRLNAFQCAEAALRNGENYIGEANGQPDNSTGLAPIQGQNQVWGHDASSLSGLVEQTAAWWATNGWDDSSLSDPSILIGCANAADYVVQSLGGIGGDGSGDLSFKKQVESQIDGYRITSRSEGVSENAVVILQSTYLRQFH